jgi:hypothetical protein
MEKFKPAEQSRQSATDADMTPEQAIEILRKPSDHTRYRTGEGLLIAPKYVRAVELAEKALQAYRKPSADQAEQIDRAIELMEWYYQNCKLRVASGEDFLGLKITLEQQQTIITALRRMAGEGK